MLVKHTGDHIGYGISPVNFLGPWENLLFNAFNYRAYLELRVFEKGEQQFQRAVAGAPTDAVEGSIKKVDPVDNSGNGIGKGKLLVVVAVNANGFIRHSFEVFGGQGVNVF